jgi:hypothetical protein
LWHGGSVKSKFAANKSEHASKTTKENSQKGEQLNHMDADLQRGGRGEEKGFSSLIRKAE